jgi:Flp pilus assembly protein TadD
VDDPDHPLKELRRLVDVARAYNAMNDGDAAIEKGDFAAAQTHYGDAMKGASGNPEPTFWYAVALANKGRVDEAVKLLPKVYAIEPRFRQLPARLAVSGLLPNDPKLIERLEKARKQ